MIDNVIMTFEDLRAFMWESPKGQVVDSLIAVEIGLDDYATFWQAHCDFVADTGEDYEEHDLVLDFLVEIADMIDLAEASEDIDKVLGAHAHE